jgi:outer membrane biogenesis lipoprotein LolB
MNIFSTVLVSVLAGALLAGCSGSAPYRSGKGNDHLVMYRPHGVEQSRIVEVREQPRIVQRQEVVYVREPYVYDQPAPAYRVVTAQPSYSTVTSRPAYRYVPVTRSYYYTE